MTNPNSADPTITGEQAEKLIACPSCGLAVSTMASVCPKDGTVLNSAPKINPNFSQHYEILGKIGAGGMSVIYKARQTSLNKVVAIKMLHLHLLNDQAIRRFQQEATAAFSLRHANVIAVHDFGLTEGGQPYMVMDLIEGITLADLIQEKGSLPLPEAMDIFRAVCDALEHAHARGVLHRDLKPSNIMLSQHSADVNVHLVDFGIAKILDTGPGGIGQKLTQTGELCGSPLYMSPEQCMGRTVDQRSDIYSLGCILYEALVGRPPHTGETLIQTIFSHLNDVALPLNEARTDIVFPQSLVDLVTKLLAKKPEDRYQSIAQVKQELLNIQSGALKGEEKKPIWGFKRITVTRSLIISLAGVLMMLIGMVSLMMAMSTAGKSALHDHVESLRAPSMVVTGTRISDTEKKIFNQLRGALPKKESVDDTKLSACLEYDNDRKKLDLSNSRITDESMEDLAGVAHLDDLNLANTRVTDISQLARCKSLTKLNLSNTTLSATALAKAADITQLERLWLNGTAADDGTLLEIGKMPKLHRLELRDTQITDTGLQYLAAGKISELAISGTGITDKGVDSIGHLPLASLAIWDTKISANGLQGLDKCQQLASLSVGRTALSQISLNAISKLTALRDLHLSHIRNLHDDDLRYLSKLNLEKLYMDDCPLTDNSARYVDSMQSLKHLNMNQTRISDKFLSHIEHLGLLETIWLEDTSTTDEGIRSLVKLQNLKKIGIAGNGITDAGLESLAALPHLENITARFVPKITRQGIAALKKKLPGLTVSANND